MLATLMVSFTMMAGNVKKSTTLPIVGEVVKASHPMIQYVGRVSFAKNPDVASFNYRKCEEINYSSYCGRGRKGFSSDDSVCWACELC